MAVGVTVWSLICCCSWSEYSPCLMISGLLCEFYPFYIWKDMNYICWYEGLCFQTKKKECWSIYTWEMFKLQLLRLERLLNCILSERRLYCHNVKSTKMEDWKDQSQGCIPAAIPCYKCEFWYIYFDPIISSPGLISFCQIILPFYQSCLCSISEHNLFLQRRFNLLH